MDAIIITFGVVASLLCIMLLALSGEGTKGIEKKPYYGRKTGTKYTASKDRDKYIVWYILNHVSGRTFCPQGMTLLKSI